VVGTALTQSIHFHDARLDEHLALGSDLAFDRLQSLTTKLTPRACDVSLTVADIAALDEMRPFRSTIG